MSDIARVAEPEDPPRMGVGEFPESLDRLNWSAVLWGGLWMLVYGAWPWFWSLIGLRVVSTVLQSTLSRAGMSDPILIGASVVASLGWYGVVIAFAYRANRFLWVKRAKHSAPTKTQPGAPTELVADYTKSQRRGALFGLLFIVLSEVATLSTARPSLSVPHKIAYVAVDVCVLTGLFLFDRVSSARRQG